MGHGQLMGPARDRAKLVDSPRSRSHIGLNTSAFVSGHGKSMGRQKRKQGGRTTAKTQTRGAPQPNPNEELPVDPEWCDIASLTVDPSKYNRFEPPRQVCDGMVADRASWARGATNDVVHCVASAIAKNTVPWAQDWQEWLSHAADFFENAL